MKHKFVFYFSYVPSTEGITKLCLQTNEKVNVNNAFQCFIVCELGEGWARKEAGWEFVGMTYRRR